MLGLGRVALGRVIVKVLFEFGMVGVTDKWYGGTIMHSCLWT